MSQATPSLSEHTSLINSRNPVSYQGTIHNDTHSTDSDDQPPLASTDVTTSTYAIVGFDPKIVSSPAHHGVGDRHIDVPETPLFGFKAYTDRFVMLGLFSFLSFSNAILWITYSPIATIVEDKYNVTAFDVNGFALIYMLIYIPCGFMGASIIEQRSLRTGVVLSAALNILGACVRVLPYPFSHAEGRTGFAFAFLGQSIASVAQIFILAVPPKVAQNWFPPAERVQATSFGALANQLGIGVGFFIPPALVHGTGGLHTVVIVEAAICVVAGILIFLFFKSSPPTPASPSSQYSAENPQDVSIRACFEQLKRKRSYHVLFVVFGCVMGAFYCFSTLVEQILHPYGYDSDFAGLLGFTLVAAGLPSTVLAGYLADKLERRHKVLLASATFSALAFMVGFTFNLKSNNKALLLVFACFLGFMWGAVLPVGLDLSIETTFPVPESVSSTLLMIGAQIFGITFILTLTSPPSKQVAWSLVGISAFATAGVYFFKCNYLRLEAEDLDGGDDVDEVLNEDVDKC